MPGLVLFLGLGMLVGSDVLGWIYFDDAELARTIGVVAVALILFEGGLVSGWRELRPVLVPSLSLAYPRARSSRRSWRALAAAWIFDLLARGGLLVGAVISATDGAAIFAVLRTSALERRLALTLEGESGFNDAVALMLVIGFIDWIQKPDYGLLDLAGLAGHRDGDRRRGRDRASGSAASGLMQRIDFATPGPLPGADDRRRARSPSAAPTSCSGSGFLAVYIAGLILGSAPIPARRTVTAFHQGSPGWARSRCSSRSGCWCSRRSWATSPSRACCWRSS